MVAIVTAMVTACVSSGQPPDVYKLKVNNIVQLRNPAGSECVVKVIEHDTQRLITIVKDDSAVCGLRGRRLTISNNDVLEILPYRENPHRRRLRGLKVAGACAAVIMTGVMLGFATEKGLAAWPVVGAGLAGIFWHVRRNKVRYTVLVANFT